MPVARLLTSDSVIVNSRCFKLLSLWLFVTQPPAGQSSASPDSVTGSPLSCEAVVVVATAPGRDTGRVMQSP